MFEIWFVLSFFLWVFIGLVYNYLIDFQVVAWMRRRGRSGAEAPGCACLWHPQMPGVGVYVVTRSVGVGV